jgi:hypothetical protein
MTFIGPKPTDGPKYCTPFKADYYIVLDANDVEVTTVDLESSTDDAAMAQAIVDALNEKFGEKIDVAPKLRTLIGWYLGLNGEEGEFVYDSRVYEISHGRFVWADSRKEAESREPGWMLPNNHYRLVDVETGEEVTE